MAPSACGTAGFLPACRWHASPSFAACMSPAARQNALARVPSLLPLLPPLLPPPRSTYCYGGAPFKCPSDMLCKGAPPYPCVEQGWCSGERRRGGGGAAQQDRVRSGSLVPSAICVAEAWCYAHHLCDRTCRQPLFPGALSCQPACHRAAHASFATAATASSYGCCCRQLHPPRPPVRHPRLLLRQRQRVLPRRRGGCLARRVQPCSASCSARLKGSPVVLPPPSPRACWLLLPPPLQLPLPLPLPPLPSMARPWLVRPPNPLPRTGAALPQRHQLQRPGGRRPLLRGAQAQGQVPGLLGRLPLLRQAPLLRRCVGSRVRVPSLHERSAAPVGATGTYVFPGGSRVCVCPAPAVPPLLLRATDAGSAAHPFGHPPAGGFQHKCPNGQLCLADGQANPCKVCGGDGHASGAWVVFGQGGARGCTQGRTPQHRGRPALHVARPVEPARPLARRRAAAAAVSFSDPPTLPRCWTRFPTLTTTLCAPLATAPAPGRGRTAMVSLWAVVQCSAFGLCAAQPPQA